MKRIVQMSTGGQERGLWLLVVCLLALTAVSSVALARTATPPPRGNRIYDMKWLNINKWRCPFYNDGRYGIDITRGSGRAGGSWPQPYLNQYIFGAGLWFGSLKRRADDTAKVDTLVTFGYNPNSGGTEMTPTSAANAAGGAGSQNDRVFVYPSDWPPRPRDWFVKEGVPDSLVPTEAFSLMDMWCVYSDLGAENHIAPGKPQGIEIYQTVYAWNYPSNQDIFFLIYMVRNAGTDTLKKCFMGAVMDPDIGAAPDDMVGLLLNDTVPGAGLVQNVGYAGDYDNYEAPSDDWQEGTPGVFAYKFLESPRGPGGTRLGMKAFKKFTIDIDPVTDPAQYMTMAGFDYRTGVYSPYDSVDLVPADKRFIQCSGPFDLAPGQVEKLIVAAMCAPFGGPRQSWPERPKDSLVHLAKLANTAQFIYDQNWLLPGPPLSPNITLVPGDNQVRIVWDNLSEVEPDKYWVKVAGDTSSPGYDPNYRGYDFQGYILYKSTNGSDWQILTQCDLKDSITFSYPPAGDSSQPDSLWIKATDNGVFYSYLDTKVRNGFTYYYCVTAYDFNFVTTSDTTRDTLILRSGIVSNFSTVPRWEEANFVMPACTVVSHIGATETAFFCCSTKVVVPRQVTGDTFVIKFLGPEWSGSGSVASYRYFVNKLGIDSPLVVDTTGFKYTIASTRTLARFYAPVFNGQELMYKVRLGGPTAAFTAIQPSGNYPAESLKPGSAPTQAWWAFRGSDYKVIWTNSRGFLSAKVIDVTNGGIEVSYAPFATTGQGPRNANGWCFVDRSLRVPSETLKTGTAQMYICGGYFQFRPGPTDTLGALLNRIGVGDTWYLTGDRSKGAAPFYNEFHLVSTAGYADTTTQRKLNVKVVPNPYIVYNSWEKNSEERRVRFTHLPDECDIRIFTTSGDLVKTIHHTGSRASPGDLGGTATWDFVNESGQLIAPGVYVFHVESKVGEFVGKLVFIH